MKLTFILLITFILSLCSIAQDTDFIQFLNNQACIQSIEKIQGNNSVRETYKLMIKQPLEHKDTTKGYFNQRVYVSFNAIEKPVVLITEGYVAEQAKRNSYLNELTQILDANQIDIEHRYFGESWPEEIKWEYLTVENAAGDHHKITELFKKYYTGKWINTGISKGGQTAMFHRKFFPDDVDVTIAYVAPLNFAVEDGRHEPFIDEKTKNDSSRIKITQFQTEILKRRKSIFPLFQTFINQNKYTFKIPLQKVYDYCVLEYSFAFLQWGADPEQIPGTNESDQVIFDHFIKISSPNYFANEGIKSIRSFFIQAAHELGYYGYKTDHLRKYLKIRSSKNYLSKIFLPKGVKINFDKSTMQRIQYFLDSTDKKMIFIYGELDPWSATAVEVPQKENLLKITKTGGSHKTRINNLPDTQKEEIYSKLSDWLDLQIN